MFGKTTIRKSRADEKSNVRGYFRLGTYVTTTTHGPCARYELKPRRGVEDERNDKLRRNDALRPWSIFKNGIVDPAEETFRTSVRQSVFPSFYASKKSDALRTSVSLERNYCSEYTGAGGEGYIREDMCFFFFF